MQTREAGKKTRKEDRKTDRPSRIRRPKKSGIVFLVKILKGNVVPVWF